MGSRERGAGGAGQGASAVRKDLSVQAAGAVAVQQCVLTLTHNQQCAAPPVTMMMPSTGTSLSRLLVVGAEGSSTSTTLSTWGGVQGVGHAKSYREGGGGSGEVTGSDVCPWLRLPTYDRRAAQEARRGSYGRCHVRMATLDGRRVRYTRRG